MGSPPHMRGKARSRTLGRVHCRITPAYAGKRTRRNRSPSLLRDHPRICGEKEVDDETEKNVEGSPPHMRGKDALAGRDIELIRITPAYAGKSFRAVSFRGPDQDHPRICGEKLLLGFFHGLAVGSPPHMRGKEAVVAVVGVVVGITPAYAGKSAACSSSPRRASGSPPHMRGKACSVKSAYTK